MVGCPPACPSLNKVVLAFGPVVLAFVLGNLDLGGPGALGATATGRGFGWQDLQRFDNITWISPSPRVS